MPPLENGCLQSLGTRELAETSGTRLGARTRLGALTP
jgi:hypothetical protein